MLLLCLQGRQSKNNFLDLYGAYRLPYGFRNLKFKFDRSLVQKNTKKHSRKEENYNSPVLLKRNKPNLRVERA